MIADLALDARSAARFWSKVSVGTSTECWPWTAALQLGYGRFGLAAGRVGNAHRIAFHNLVGPIPEGKVIDHLCRNRACCNPAHLEPVTIGENVMRGDTAPARQAAQTHCVHGHEFSDENTYRWRTKRYCKACHAARQRARRDNTAA